MRAFQGFLIVFAAGCGLATPVLADDVGGVDVTISNFHQVDEHVYRSGRPQPDEIQELAALGIKTVLTLETYALDPGESGDEEAAAGAAGLQFLRVAMNPLPIFAPSDADIQAAVDIMTDPANQPVLVHCYAGSDRTGMVVGAYHIEVDHWTPEQAIADMRNFGHSFLFYGWDSKLYDFAPR